MSNEPVYLDRSPPGFEDALEIASDLMEQLSYEEESTLHHCLAQHLATGGQMSSSPPPFGSNSGALLRRITELPCEMQHALYDFIAADLAAQRIQQSR